MRICLINPSIIDEKKNASPLSTRNKYFINPYNLSHLGLGYIAAVLKKEGFECDVIECPVEGLNPDEVLNRISESDYDAFGISSYYYNYKNTVKIAMKLRKKYKNAFIFLGGLLPTLSPQSLMETLDFIDCCVVGEGELITLQLVQAINEGRPWRSIPGIAFVENGEICINDKCDLIQNLDVLPFPVRPFVSDRKIASIITSRGCYGNCTYCGIREFFHTCRGSAYRRRSPKNVVDEIEYIVNQFQIEFISISDGIFHFASKVGEKWFDEFEKQIKERNINVKFLCDFRANEVVANPEIVRRFKNIGLYNVNIGIESFVQKQLDFYNKGTTVEQNIKAIKIVDEYEIYYTIGILIFDPTTVLDEVIEYIDTMRNMGYYSKNYNITRPLSIGSRVVATTGTRLFEYVINNNLYVQNGFNYKFENQNTEICYEVVEKWSNIVAPIFNLNYIAFLSKENGLDDIDEEVRTLFQRLYKVDMQFIRDLCMAIKNGIIHNGDEASELIGEFMEDIQHIEMRLKELEKILSCYY